MFRALSALAVTVLALLSASSGLQAQCVNRTDLRTRVAQAPAPALGTAVAYSLGSSYLADADFSFGGYACTAQDRSPAVSYSENTSFDLFGTRSSYGVRSLASAGGWAFVLVDVTTPTASNTLAGSIGASGIAAILPAVNPYSETINVGTTQVGFLTLQVRPRVTYAADPTSNFQAVGRSRSANLTFQIGIETTLAYSQRGFTFFVPVEANLSGKVQDVFVSGFSNAMNSATAATVRGNYALRDDGSNLNWRVTFAGVPISTVNWSRPSGSLQSVSW